MSNPIFNASEIRTWLEMGSSGPAATIIPSEITEAPEGVVADYDTPSKIGRITIWLAGFSEFEILAVDDRRQIYFRHEEELQIDSPVLQRAFSEFISALAD